MMDEEHLTKIAMTHELYPHIINLYNRILGINIRVETSQVDILVGQDPELDAVFIDILQKAIVASNYIEQVVGEAKTAISECLEQHKVETFMAVKHYECSSHLGQSSQKRTRSSTNSQDFSQQSTKKPRLKERIAKDKVLILRQWLFEHAENPYPTVEEKQRLATATGLTRQQINQWFVNARRRILKRMKQATAETSWTVADYVRILAEHGN